MPPYKAHENPSVEKASLDLAEHMGIPLWIAVGHAVAEGRRRVLKAMETTGSGSLWVTSPWGTAMADLEVTDEPRELRPTAPEEEPWAVTAYVLVGVSALLDERAILLVRVPSVSYPEKEALRVWVTDGRWLSGVTHDEKVALPITKGDAVAVLPWLDSSVVRVTTPDINLM